MTLLKNRYQHLGFEDANNTYYGFASSKKGCILVWEDGDSFFVRVCKNHHEAEKYEVGEPPVEGKAYKFFDVKGGVPFSVDALKGEEIKVSEGKNGKVLKIKITKKRKTVK